MASARATKVAEGFSQRLLKEVYELSVADKVVNRDYQGEINGVGSKLNIYNVDRISEKNYVKNNNGNPDGLYENNAVLEIGQKKMFYWAEYTIDNWIAYIKDVHSTVVNQKADERAKNMDAHVLGLYGDVAAGNRVGTDETAGTVAIDVNGNVTGSSTNFTAAMVGRGFQATGHGNNWYRVKSYATATSIVIEDDLDDVTSQYTGGVIGAGATYKIEASTAVALTTSNLLQYFALAKLKLNTAERLGKSAVPTSDRWAILPPEFEDIVVRANGVALHVPDVYQELVKSGFLGMFQGFKVFISNRLTGDNTSGFRCLLGHSNWLTFAEKLLSADIEEEIKGDFGTAYKDLFVYGGKVADKRRHFAVELFATFTI